MRGRTLSMVALAGLLAASAADAADAAPKKLTLLVTGDNWGEIAPCG